MNDQLLAIKNGRFTDAEVNQTKEMIRRTMLLSQDNQDSIIDRILKPLFGKSVLDMDTLMRD